MTNLDKIREIIGGDNFRAIYLLLGNFGGIFCHNCCEQHIYFPSCKGRCSVKIYNWLKMEYDNSENMWGIITGKR